MRLAEGGEHLHATTPCDRRNLADQTALTDPRRPHHPDHHAVALDRTIQQALDSRHLPAPTDEIRFGTPGSAMPFFHAQQAMGSRWFLGTLDTQHLRFAE